ncbi:peptidylprolyl isomerase [Bengtsoniella intestinalis]|uniref:peptidylprolyl isomerase n=1 Tax=Bengtsoniella intestinalis TaxID=3073143 RepID=UPI00391F5C65
MKKSLSLLLSAFLAVTLLAGCASETVTEEVEEAPVVESVEGVETPEPDVTDAYEVTHTVTMTIAELGTIELELYGNLAPATVENFVSLAESGFYDGLIFHRVIAGFMIQGGDPLGNGTGGSDTKITGEFIANGFANDLSHSRGVISMARSSAYDSASSQFFIMHADYPYLDGDYAAFGKVTSGLEVVDAIAAMETNSSDKPLEDVVIASIVVN